MPSDGGASTGHDAGRRKARGGADFALRAASVALVLYSLGALLSRPRVIRIVISKSERMLRLLDEEARAVREYPIAIGRAPGGPKTAEGDQRTPEGDYRVCVKNPRSRFRLSLGLSYPNAADARRGAEAGLIAAEQFEAIEAAERERRRPPWDTPLGGEIFIHGGATGREGTRGCIAVSDEAIEEIYSLVDEGTPVRIEP